MLMSVTQEYQSSLYPNPGRDYFRLSWPEHDDDPKDWDMWVYDLTGRVIHRIPNVTNGANVQTAGWGRGVYVIRVRGEGVVYEARWIHID